MSKVDFNNADVGEQQARKGRADMMARREDYDKLVDQMAIAFLGDAGSENGVFQANFRTAVNEFFTALGRLNGALAGSVGTQGTVKHADLGMRQHFNIA